VFFGLQEVCARTRSRFRAFGHLSFKCCMCGMKESLRSKITPRNLVSSTTGTRVSFSRRVGSGWGLRNLRKCVHTRLSVVLRCLRKPHCMGEISLFRSISIKLDGY